MHPRRRAVSLLGIAVLLGACSSGGSGATATTAPGGTTGAGGAGGATGSGGGTGADGLPGSACALLTLTDIQQAVGAPVKPGAEQDSSGQVGCDWNGTTDTGPSVGVTVATYDDTLWQAGSQAGYSSPVSGIGEAAFKGWPTAGTLNVKVKGLAVTVGVVDFTKPSADIDAESLALAKIVLSKL